MEYLDLHKLFSPPYIYLIIGGFLFSVGVIATCTGKVSARFCWVYRAKEPTQFWGLVAIYSLAGVFSLESSCRLGSADLQTDLICDSAGGPDPKEVNRATEGGCPGSLAFGDPGDREPQPDHSQISDVPVVSPAIRTEPRFSGAIFSAISYKLDEAITEA